MKITDFENVVLITDDGPMSLNTHIFYKVLKGYFENVYMLTNHIQISAKSNAISLVPILKSSHEDTPNILVLGGYPNDCLLYGIFNLNLNLQKTLFIFGINNHNHWGYHNYTSATTSMLSILKHFELKGFSVSSEIDLDDNYLTKLIPHIFEKLNRTSKKYCSFNINEKTLTFSFVNKTKKLLDQFYETLTVRGIYVTLSYNRPEKLDKNRTDECGTDLHKQIIKKNYIVEVF